MLAIIIVVTVGAALINGKVEAEEFIAVVSMVIALVTGGYAVRVLSTELTATRTLLERDK